MAKNFENNKTQPEGRQMKMPQNHELESAVLGAIISEEDGHNTGWKLLGEIYAEMSESFFYDQRNKIVFQAIKNLYFESVTVNLLNIKNKIKSLGQAELVPASYVMGLVNGLTYHGLSCVNVGNIREQILVLRELQIRRAMISTAQKALQSAMDESMDVLESLEEMDTALLGINNGLFESETQPMDEAIVQSIEKILTAHQKGGITAVPTGVEELDRVIGGFFAGDLSIIAGRPGMGKTTVALHLLRIASQCKHNVGFMSLEMSTESLAHKEIIREMHQRVPHTDLNLARLRMAKLHTGEAEILAQIQADINPYLHRIKVSQKSSLPLSAIKSKAREWVKKHKITILVIDYLQLIGDDQAKKNDNRNLEVERISNGLKALAKELGIGIVALAQLSRNVETRANKKPQLSDLRDSGGIEQAADNVIFLYRPEYYGIEQDERGFSTKGVLEFVVAKNRNGQLAEIPAHADLKAGTISSIIAQDFMQKENAKPSKKYEDVAPF